MMSNEASVNKLVEGYFNDGMVNTFGEDSSQVWVDGNYYVIEFDEVNQSVLMYPTKDHDEDDVLTHWWRPNG